MHRMGGVFVLVVALVASLPAATPVAAQGLMVTGYGNVEYVNQKGSNHTFDAHNLNLILIGKLRGDLFAAGEVEYEHGGEEIALEYAYLAFTRLRYLNIVAGKFIVPFGTFNVNHPAWINKVPGRPFGMDRVMPATYSDIGLLLRGAVPAGYLSRVTYDVWAVNGLSGAEGDDIRNLRDNSLVDLDRNKFLGGRLGYVARMGLDVGLSVHTGDYDSTATRNTLTLLGVDAAFQKSGFELRGEYVQATQETGTGDLNKSGFYLQAAYAVTPTIEPTVRFSQMEFPGASNRDLREVSVGVSVYPSDLGALRVFVRFDDERSVPKIDNNSLIVQFTVGF